uniref:Uncharacterized protein n=1 Tax=Anguilla anguilla TaxID=7936 RepID=A0A0E9XR07_ANGAN
MQSNLFWGIKLKIEFCSLQLM